MTIQLAPLFNVIILFAMDRGAWKLAIHVPES
uniref:Uncharacterized protein n=1 Tax=Arundo donax TaxID=35708 RepID=A0A0A9DDA0_ARUDO